MYLKNQSLRHILIIITCSVSSSFGLVFLTGGKKNSEL